MLKKQQTINRIRIAVGETIAEKGVKASTLTAIARKAGFDKMLIYRYFGGYTGLIETYFHDVLQGILDRIPGQRASDRNPLTVWQAFLLLFYRELRTNTAFQHLFRWLYDHPQTLLAQRLSSILNHTIDQVALTYSGDVRVGYQLFMGGVIHLVLSTSSPVAPDRIDQYEQAILLFLRNDPV